MAKLMIEGFDGGGYQPPSPLWKLQLLMMSVDDLLFEPIVVQTGSRIVRHVCASCQKMFDKPDTSSEQYCEACRKQNNWSTYRSDACSGCDGTCGGCCC